MAHAKRVALITGSSSGIGAASAIALAKAGFDVVVTYGSSEKAGAAVVKLCQDNGADALLAKCDVSSEQDILAVVEQIKKKYGRLDVVCSNAGTSIDVPPREFDKISVEDWDKVFAVNVRGLFLVAKHTKPLLMAANEPCMVITASIVGLRPGAQPLPYSASKAAVISMTQTLAGALGPKIRVNAIAPGWMEGDWMQRMLKDNYQKLMDRRAAATPLKRCVTAEDVAEVVVTLVERMKFVTGETIVIDGGFAKTT